MNVELRLCYIILEGSRGGGLDLVSWMGYIFAGYAPRCVVCVQFWHLQAKRKDMLLLSGRDSLGGPSYVPVQEAAHEIP